MPKMSRFLYENHRGSPTLTLLNVFGVLVVLNVLNLLNVLNVLNVLHVLNMLMDASLACWALFSFVFSLVNLNRPKQEVWNYPTRLVMVMGLLLYPSISVYTSIYRSA